jgi:hypothetical protein
MRTKEPFKPKTLHQQKKEFIASVRRRENIESCAITTRHWDEVEKARKLSQQNSEISKRIDAIQNSIANKADHEFGGWDVWRHDSKLLAVVATRMDKDPRVVKCRARIIFNKELAEKLMKPHDDEMRKLYQETAMLIKTAKS